MNGGRRRRLSDRCCGVGRSALCVGCRRRVGGDGRGGKGHLGIGPRSPRLNVEVVDMTAIDVLEGSKCKQDTTATGDRERELSCDVSCDAWRADSEETCEEFTCGPEVVEWLMERPPLQTTPGKERVTQKNRTDADRGEDKGRTRNGKRDMMQGDSCRRRCEQKARANTAL